MTQKNTYEDDSPKNWKWEKDRINRWWPKPVRKEGEATMWTVETFLPPLLYIRIWNGQGEN